MLKLILGLRDSDTELKLRNHDIESKLCDHYIIMALQKYKKVNYKLKLCLYFYQY